MKRNPKVKPRYDKLAAISECGRFRYSLWRGWSDAPPCCFIMLNPSTADGEQDDPTIRRCVSFAQRWGCGELYVMNLFALRATDPKELLKHADRVGPDNDSWLKQDHQFKYTVAAWGVHGELDHRADAVVKLLEGRAIYCLGITKDGHPRHPLYVRGDQPLMEYFQESPQ